MSFGGRLGGSFGSRLFFGRDCEEILHDERGDPFEKDVCESFRHFDRMFGKEEEQDWDDLYFNPEGSGIEKEDKEQEKSSSESQSSKQLRDKLFRSPEEEHGRLHKGGRPYSRSLPGDRNLDEKLAEDPGSLDKFLSPEDKNKAMIQGPPFGSSRSESIVIRQYPDGSVEERKTVRNSDGTYEENVTRRSRDGTITNEHGSDETQRDENWMGRVMDTFNDWMSWSKRS